MRAGPRSVLGANRVSRRSRRGGREVESASVGCVRPVPGGVANNRQVAFDDDGWRLKTDAAEQPDPAQSDSLAAAPFYSPPIRMHRPRRALRARRRALPRERPRPDSTHLRTTSWRCRKSSSACARPRTATQSGCRLMSIPPPPSLPGQSALVTSPSAQSLRRAPARSPRRIQRWISTATRNTAFSSASDGNLRTPRS